MSHKTCTCKTTLKSTTTTNYNKIENFPPVLGFILILKTDTDKNYNAALFLCVVEPIVVDLSKNKK